MLKARIASLMLVLTVAVAALGDTAFADHLRPIVARSSTSRICVELCSGALGGAGCGDFCLDLIPDSLPVQYGLDNGAAAAANATASGVGGIDEHKDTINDNNNDHKDDLRRHAAAAHPRESVCGVLCENNLGYPLCQCESRGITKKRDLPDFIEVCAIYCNTYNYQLRGCQECQLYKLPQRVHYHRLLLGNSDEDPNPNPKPEYDWKAWCSNQCSADNGGAACNCDRLPMMASV